MSEGPVDLAERLREAIRASGLGQRDLARKADIDQGQLSRFLNGSQTLTLTVASKLCAVLGLRLVKQDGPAGEGPGEATGGQGDGTVREAEQAKPTARPPTRRKSGHRPKD